MNIDDDNNKYDDRFDVCFDENVEVQGEIINSYKFNITLNYDLVYQNDLLIPTLKFIIENNNKGRICLFNEKGEKLDYNMLIDSIKE